MSPLRSEGPPSPGRCQPGPVAVDPVPGAHTAQQRPENTRSAVYVSSHASPLSEHHRPTLRQFQENPFPAQSYGTAGRWRVRHEHGSPVHKDPHWTGTRTGSGPGDPSAASRSRNPHPKLRQRKKDATFGSPYRPPQVHVLGNTVAMDRRTSFIM